MSKKFFILYNDQKEIFDQLSDELAGQLIKALFEYEATKEMPQLPEPLNFIMIPIKQALDRHMKKYVNICEKNRINGQLGGLAKNKGKRPLATASERYNPLANGSDSSEEVINKKEEVINNKEYKNSLSEIENSRQSSPKKSNVPYLEIIKLYDKHLGNIFPTVRLPLADHRRRALRARWLSDLKSLRQWDKFFNIIAQSDFLMGRITGRDGRTYRGSLDSIITPSMCTKILEDHFSNYR